MTELHRLKPGACAGILRKLFSGKSRLRHAAKVEAPGSSRGYPKTSLASGAWNPKRRDYGKSPEFQREAGSRKRIPKDAAGACEGVDPKTPTKESRENV